MDDNLRITKKPVGEQLKCQQTNHFLTLFASKILSEGY